MHGCWVEADQDPDDVRDDIQEMLMASHTKDSEEWAIHAYEGFGEKILSEYEDINTVVNLAEFITKHSELFGLLYLHVSVKTLSL